MESPYGGGNSLSFLFCETGGCQQFEAGKVPRCSVMRMTLARLSSERGTAAFSNASERGYEIGEHRRRSPWWAVGADAQGSAGGPGEPGGGTAGVGARAAAGRVQGPRPADASPPRGIAQPARLLPAVLLENRLTEALAVRWCLFSQAPEEAKLLHRCVYSY